MDIPEGTKKRPYEELDSAINSDIAPERLHAHHHEENERKKVHTSKELSEHETKLYDRQIRLWGIDTQHRIRNSRLLLVGRNGLTNEIAKNLVLAGVGQLVWITEFNSCVGQNVNDSHVRISADPEKTMHNRTHSLLSRGTQAFHFIQKEDLCSQFLLDATDLGHSRAECLYRRLHVLNPTVHIEVYDEVCGCYNRKHATGHVQNENHGYEESFPLDSQGILESADKDQKVMDNSCMECDSPCLSFGKDHRPFIDIICLVNVSVHVMLSFTEICRQRKIVLYCTRVDGHFGWVFADLHQNFKYTEERQIEKTNDQEEKVITEHIAHYHGFSTIMNIYQKIFARAIKWLKGQAILSIQEHDKHMGHVSNQSFPKVSEDLPFSESHDPCSVRENHPFIQAIPASTTLELKWNSCLGHALELALLDSSTHPPTEKGTFLPTIGQATLPQTSAISSAMLAVARRRLLRYQRQLRSQPPLCASVSDGQMFVLDMNLVAELRDWLLPRLYWLYFLYISKVCTCTSTTYKDTTHNACACQDVELFSLFVMHAEFPNSHLSTCTCECLETVTKRTPCRMDHVNTSDSTKELPYDCLCTLHCALKHLLVYDMDGLLHHWNLAWTPVCAIVGGLASQEMIKSIGGKEWPIHGFVIDTRDMTNHVDDEASILLAATQCR